MVLARGHCGSGHRQAGFTLVELLVVIGIIAILAGMLLPVLAKGRNQAEGVRCLSNLRQMQVAWYSYATDNNGILPPNQFGGFRYQEGAPTWVEGAMLFETGLLFSFFPTDPTNQVLLLTKNPGGLGPYTGAAGIYKCPSDRSWILLNGARHQRLRSYSLNGYLGNNRNSSTIPNSWHYGKLDQLRGVEGVGLITFIDEHADFVNDGLFEALAVNSPWGGVPAGRHGKGGSLAFSDGHVSIRKWQDPRTLIPEDRNVPQLNVVEQAGNPDIKWMFLRMSDGRGL